MRRDISRTSPLDVRSLSRLFTNKLATDGLRLSHKKARKLHGLHAFLFKRRKWDLNPCDAINVLLPFQGSPFSLLGISPSTDHDAASDISISTRGMSSIFHFIMNAETFRLPHFAENVGFEPTVPCGITGFQDQRLQPLGQLSSLHVPVTVNDNHFTGLEHAMIIVSCGILIVKCFFFKSLFFPALSPEQTRRFECRYQREHPGENFLSDPVYYFIPPNS